MPIVTLDHPTCLYNTIQALNHLAACGPQEQQKGAQVCKPILSYLGFQEEKDKKCDAGSDAATVANYIPHQEERIMRVFRNGSTCCVWKPNCGPAVQPLEGSVSSHWFSQPLTGKTCQVAFPEIKTQLLIALPNPSKTSELYVHEEQGMGLKTRNSETE